MKKIRMTLEQRKGVAGVLFVGPWFIGFLMFFAVPMAESFRFSLNHLELAPGGMKTTFQGFSKYMYALTEHATFNRVLTESVTNMVVNVPLIVIFSLFTASLINQKFKGRAIARAIFFLPVILASGAIASLESADFLQDIMRRSNQEQSGNFSMLRGFELQRMLIQANVPPWLVGYLTGAVNRIYQIISSSGVQILIFLAGLQSISPSLYEASKIEGATPYESFWKITFPMVSPLILTNVIYSVIDSFMNNNMTRLIQETAFRLFDFGLSAAMSWVYFGVITVILGITAALISRKVFYYD